jgi:cell wall integrity and stress response component
LSLETITGQVKTVTVTPTAPPSDAETTTAKNSKSGSGLSTGAIVGITIASILGGGAVLILLIWACLARRRRNQTPSPSLLTDEGKSSNEGRSTSGPSRTMSGNSRFVLETNGEKVVQSFVEDGPSNRRGSQMLPVDPRLDPFNKLYQKGNMSRDSIATIRDEHDYSRKITPTGGRVLRAMNPDE